MSICIEITDKLIIYNVEDNNSINFSEQMYSELNTIIQIKKNRKSIIFNIYLCSNEDNIISKIKEYNQKIFKKESGVKFQTLKINTIKKSNIINWFLEKNVFDTIIFDKKYNKINPEIKFNNFDNTHIKNVVYTNRLLYSINQLPKNLLNLTIRFKTYKNFKIIIPDELKSIILNEFVVDLTNFNVKSVGVINKKQEKNNLDIIESDLLCVYKYEKNSIDINNLSNKIKILYLLDKFNEPINFLPHSIEKLVLGVNFSKSLSNIPITVKTLELKHLYFDLKFITELHNFVENLLFDATNICTRTCNNYNLINFNLFDDIKLPETLKTIKFIILRVFTLKKNEFEKLLKCHLEKNNLETEILIKKKN